MEGGAGLKALVLGSAAGGGFPQWNSACRLCVLAWAQDPRARPRTQASVAVSADGEHWLLIGASPDLRQQILAQPALHPREGARSSPVFGVALVSADVDGIAGLLVLRESQPLEVFGEVELLSVLGANRVFEVLDPVLVRRRAISMMEAVDCGYGLTLTLLPMPGKIPLYLEDRGAREAERGQAFAAQVRAGGSTVIVAPACAEITDAVLAQLAGADVLFFDGTLFTDREMIEAGVGKKTGRRMGHVPMTGPGGSLERLAGLTCRRIFLHINNTNPVLLDGSPEREIVERPGFEVAFDGMEVAL
jgi:pyrroloquinoline quinone biosynthesis protein B